MMTEPKSTRRVFVIMPFVLGGTRNEAQLKSFFENNIKHPIENADLHHRYVVFRSGETFDITTEIMRDLCRSDIVIADLSGIDPNPNVMYELGVRLAISEGPVILIREDNPHNKRIFDIIGFYAHPYDPYDYAALERHLIGKIERLESGEEPYTNPVLSIIREEMVRLNPGLTDVAPERQRELVLRGILAVAANVERAFGPYGAGLAIDAMGEDLVLERQGSAIARGMRSANPFEERGVRLMAQAATAAGDDLGDGTKLPIIIAHGLIEACMPAIGRGVLAKDLLEGIELGVAATTQKIAKAAFSGEERLRAIAQTAAKGPSLDLDVPAILKSAGADGLVITQEGGSKGITVQKAENMIVERGAIRPEFLADCTQQVCTLEDCFILLYPRKITSLKEVHPILELVAQSGTPLLLVAEDVEGEALSTLVVNYRRRTVRCIPIKAPGSGDRQSDLLEDIAVLTGATVLSELLGYSLETASLAMLGRASKVVVSLGQTEMVKGAGEQKAINRRVADLKALSQSQTAYDADKTRERIARMVGTIVTIEVGGGTAQQRRDNRYRVASAMAAVSLAERQGYVVGGGVTLLHAGKALSELTPQTEGQKLGIEAVRASLEKPLRVLATSAGMEADAAVKEIGEATDKNTGYNLQRRQREDLLHAGILDPASVLIRGLEIAQGITRIFLETGAWHVQHKS